MAVTAKLFGSCLAKALNKEIDLDSDTIKVMLVQSGWTPNQDTNDYKNDVTNEVAGTGYTAGGATLTGVTVTYDGATNVLKIDADDISWPTSTITARYAVIYDATPASDATRPLIGYVDFGADVISDAGAFSIAWNAAGMATITVA